MEAHLLAADRLLAGGEAAARVAGKAYFLNSGEPVEIWEFIDRLLAAAGVPAVEKRVSRRTAMVAGWVFEKILENGPDNVDKQAISNLSQNLLNPKTVVPAKEDDSVVLKENKESNGDFFNSGHSNLAEFKLPGEDEILSLINDISGNGPLQQGVDMPQKSSPEPEPEVGADVVEAEAGDLFSSYKLQAERYFTVIEQALNLVEAQPDDKTALKVIEVACKSLYELLMKMNLDSIGQTPALMSELIRSLISNRYSLSKEEHGLIKNSLQTFHEIANIADTERREFKENIISLHALKSRIKMSQSPLREPEE